MKKENPSTFLSNLKYDLPAALVVFLVALPLCMGIALGSNAPSLFAGLTAGIVGGIIVGAISGSQLSVSGPAAGLTIIVSTAIGKLPAYEAFILAVVIAGIFQIAFGKLKLGFFGDYIPAAVIKGMLAAIGLLLILKQIPHLLGSDADFMGDEEFEQPDKENTFSEIWEALNHITPGTFLIGLIAIIILMAWETNFLKKNRILSLIPGSLVAVLAGVVANLLYQAYWPHLTVRAEHMVAIPMAHSFTDFKSFFTLPDVTYLGNADVWVTAITIAIVASLESLLSLEASDKIDPYKRLSPPNRELVAQGVGNIASGLLGGLPVTAVIVRSSANVSAGARTKTSAIAHGVLLLVCVAFIPELLNLIPLSALAAVLLFVGYKLTKPTLYKEMLAKGYSQFWPFVITVFAILFTDLLIGIIIGILSGLFFVIRSNFKKAIFTANDGDKYLIRFRSEVSFLNKLAVRKWLESIPENSYVLIDASKSNFIDGDIVDDVIDFTKHALLKNIRVEFKPARNGKDHFNQKNTTT